jgi:hypothetical protein
MVIGIPIGAPSQSPEPKSGWSVSSGPIDPMIASELAATGRRSTRLFHTFDFGKIEQRGRRMPQRLDGLPPTRARCRLRQGGRPAPLYRP